MVWVFEASWRLAMFSFVVCRTGVGAGTIGRKRRKRSGQAQERMASLTPGILKKTSDGGVIVRAFRRREAFEEARFERRNTG